MPAIAPDLAPVVARAREAQRAWAALGISRRTKGMRKAKDRILDRAAAIARLIHDEIGKPEIEVLLGEVLASADVVDYWVESIEELLEPTPVPIDPLSFPRKRGRVYREARGVVGLIAPWNMPLAIPIRTIVPALLAGNAVIFKPSEVAPRTAALLVELFDGLLLPNVLTVVEGGADVGALLFGAADVDHVVFTGGVRAGRAVAHACAERLGPCSLELGGKDAAIVLADADLDRAAEGVVWGALTMAGQNCAAIERVYVEARVAEAFTAKVVRAALALSAEQVGPLATDAQLRVVLAHVAEARAAGARVLAGGAVEGDGRRFAPTVLAVDSDDLAIMREETFGPVLPIAIVQSPDEAVRRANASRYGLTASIWTRKFARAEALARELRAGVVTINNHSFTGALPAAPWSGVGDSGYGITNSPLALDALTRPRFVLVDRNRARRELWWYPYTPTLRAIALAFAVLRSSTPGLFAKLGALVRLARALPRRLLGG